MNSTGLGDSHIVLASGNKGKLAELTQLLQPLNIHLQCQQDFNLNSADETGLTFVENALLKARHVCEHTQLPALADDSGLAVDALQGQPGIYSARYAGEDACDADNNTKLLQALSSVPTHLRTARYHCILVYLRHAADPTPIICQATWEGLILEAPQGTGGFGYDPLFWVPSQACTAAQMPAELKNRLSHRGQALALLQQQLTQERVKHPFPA